MTDIKELLYGNTRCYLINGILIDTDWPGTLYGFLKCIKDADIGLSSIKYLLVTHFHPDHMGIAQELADLGVQIVVFDVQKNFIHFPDKIFKKNKMPFKPIDDGKVLIKPLSESRSFLEGAGLYGEIISTPGHSNDSISILLDDGIAIVGDLPPLHLVQSYSDEIINRSWNSILAHHPDTVYYGHEKMDSIEDVTSVDDTKGIAVE